jgi:hypothetical protein
MIAGEWTHPSQQVLGACHSVIPCGTCVLANLFYGAGQLNVSYFFEGSQRLPAAVAARLDCVPRVAAGQPNHGA